MKTHMLVIATLVGCSFGATAQELDSTKENPIKITGYLESYYSFDPNRPSSHAKPGFIYSHNRSNEIAINLGLIKASYEHNQIRSNLGLGVGTYMNANYAAEPGVFKNIYEANIGFKLSKTKQIWLDMGVLPSHIGPESAVSVDNISLTRSLSAENSPYFETGARLSYSSPNNKWYLAMMALNGWQRIQLPNTSRGLAYGQQIQYKPTAGITLNSSIYVGDEGKDSLRFFHDFYAQLNLSSSLEAVLNWDYGLQKQPALDKNYTWWNAGIQLRYAILDQLKINLRGEYFNDTDAVIFGSAVQNMQDVWGASIGLDYQIYSGLFWRTEYRYLKADQAVFEKLDAMNTKQSNHLTTSLGFKF